MTRRIIPHGPDVVLNPTVLAVGEIAFAEGTMRPRFGDGGTPGGQAGALLNDLIPYDQRLDLVEGTVTSGRLGYGLYSDLAANTTAANGVIAEVPITDTGSHTDPVVGGTVANTGVFKKAPAGWQRIYDVDAASSGAAALRAEAAARDAKVKAGFDLRSDAATFAPQMTTGERTPVSSADTGTHAAVTGEVRLDGTAATAGEQIPNAGVYSKQASGALWRVSSSDNQLTAAARDATQLAAGNAAGAGAKFIYDVNGKPVNLAVLITQTGRYVNPATGAYVVNSAYDTIGGPVRGGSPIRTNRTVPAGTGVIFRNSAGVFIPASGVASPAAFTDIPVPATATSFEMSYQKGAGVYSAEYGKTNDNVLKGLFVWDAFVAAPGDYTSPGFVDPHTANQTAQKASRARLTRTREDLYDPDKVSLETYIARSTLAETTFAGYFTTDHVPVRVGFPIYFNRSGLLGNEGFAPVWYDEDKIPISHSGCVVSADITDGSPIINVLTVPQGSPIRGMSLLGSGGAAAAFPAGTYVIDAPTNGGPGTYTLSNPAVGTFAAASMSTRGVPQGAPLYPIRGAASVRMMFLNAYLRDLRITDAPPGAGGLDVRGAWGDYDRKLLYPLRGAVGGIVGDSIIYTQATAGNHAFSYGIERRTDSYLAQISPVPGRSCRQFFDATAATAQPAVRGTTAAIDSTPIAALNFLFAGTFTNDFGLNRPLGALGDTAASGTFHGDLYDMWIAKAQTWNPRLRLFLMTPLPRFDMTTGINAGDAESLNGNPLNTLGLRLSAYADAVKAFCQRYKLTCIDMFYGGTGLNIITKVELMSDNLHLKDIAAYDYVMLPQIARAMNGQGI